jgi:chaperonin GroEL
MGGTLRLGEDAQTRVIHGACGVARAVQGTLGPRGRRVLIDDGSGRPRITKDGAAIARAIRFEDRYADMGAGLMREVTRATAEAAGDGTTTAATLAHTLLIEGFAATAAGLAPLALGEAIEVGVERALRRVAETARPVAGDLLPRIATVAANGDTSIGSVVAAELGSAGGDGLVLIEDSNAIEDSIDRRNGMHFDQGYASRAFADADPKDPAAATAIELVQPLFLFCDGPIDSLEPWLPAFDAAIAARRPLLIIAADFSAEALAMLVASRERGGLKVVAVKSPGFAATRTDLLGDLAALTGGAVMVAPAAGGATRLAAGDLGRAERVQLTPRRTTIIGGVGSTEAIEARCRWLRARVTRTADQHEERVLRIRLARLADKVAIIRVGGATEIERRERRERYEGALRSTRSALAQGVVPGGGVALYRAVDAASGVAATVEETAAAAILAKALRQPLQQIATNAGANLKAVLGMLDRNADPRLGFDAERLDCADVVERGILDPVATVTEALRNAGSIATLLLASGGFILERSERALARHPLACRCDEHERAVPAEDPLRAQHRSLGSIAAAAGLR